MVMNTNAKPKYKHDGKGLSMDRHLKPCIDLSCDEYDKLMKQKPLGYLETFSKKTKKLIRKDAVLDCRITYIIRTVKGVLKQYSIASSEAS